MVRDCDKPDFCATKIDSRDISISKFTSSEIEQNCCLHKRSILRIKKNIKKQSFVLFSKQD